MKFIQTIFDALLRDKPVKAVRTSAQNITSMNEQKNLSANGAWSIQIINRSTFDIIIEFESGELLLPAFTPGPRSRPFTYTFPGDPLIRRDDDFVIKTASGNQEPNADITVIWHLVRNNPNL